MGWDKAFARWDDLLGFFGEIPEYLNDSFERSNLIRKLESMMR